MTFLQRLALARADDLTLGTLLDRLAAIHGDRRLVEQPDGTTHTYREAADLVARWAGAIDGTKGDTAVVALPNGYDQLLACMAVSRAGLVPVPVNDRMSAEEIDHVVADAGAHLVIRSLDELATDNTQIRVPSIASSKDVAAIFYTSGTTGRPKGAELTHRALLHGPARTALWPAWAHRDEAVVALPVAHIMGFVLLLAFANAGIPVYALPAFDPVAVLDAIERRRSTVFAGVPTMYRMLLDAGAEERDLRCVRLWVSGADAMPSDLARRFQRMGASASVFGRHVGEAVFAEGWGMVETAGAAIGRINLPYLGLPAIPLPGYKVKVDDEGELLVKGPGVLAGYHDNPDATAAVLDDGWLRTGDLVRRGRLGTVSFVGRSKDVVKRGGYSVFAAEVERTLEEHPAVAQAAVVGIADDRLGEEVAAAVRLRGDANPDEIRAFAAERLTSYKVPRHIVVVDGLPLGGTGKVQKDRVKVLISTHLAADEKRRKGGP